MSGAISYPRSRRSPLRPSGVDLIDRALVPMTLEGGISATLNMTDWVIEGPRGAARILDMHPNTLRSRIKRLGLTRQTQPSRAGAPGPVDV